MAKINNSVLMSGADYFSDNDAINAYMDDKIPVDIPKAKAEHLAIKTAIESIGIKVIQVAPPENCQDGVYTANWALCRGNNALLSCLPEKRKPESHYAEQILKGLGKNILKLPDSLRFSGQGDALPCGNYLFVGSTYRTDQATHSHIKELLGYEVVSLQTIPKKQLWGFGKPVINKVTGWPDSFFYDLDLALAVLTPELIAYCPEAFVPESRSKIEALPMQKIKVSLKEATRGFACNLVSSGEAVVMSSNAPTLKANIEAHGLKTFPQDVTELAKGGGFIRCTTLTLDNN